jgi:NAD(P)-dependent dehydrogenase (short-subunit alcohol dehydrogenase family)
MAVCISLAGKVAVVTGGGRGIGRAITERLAEAGADVVIASRKMEVLEAAAHDLADLPGKVVPMPCHVGKGEEIDRLLERTRREVGPIDIIVNNSATNIGQGPSLQTTPQMLHKMVQINVESAYRMVHGVAPDMIERGQGGAIVNIVSISGLQPQPGGLLYSFTKAGLVMLTRSWARELGPHGIRVNAIAPGLIQTDFSAYYWTDEARKQELVGEQPLKRLGQPEDVGFAAVYLASDEARFVTGHTLVIDGGALA